MIARTWHGRTAAAKADDYLAFLYRSGIPDYQATPGNKGAWVMRRFEHVIERGVESDVCHFMTLSFWESREAIKAFAGADIEIAHYYPEDKDYLLEFEPHVLHYELFDSIDGLVT